jgi:transcriptional regulator with XRE-family HTH domain
MSDEVNKVSTRDVAAVAGVSATVVSWVAKGTATQHRITEATQRRVRAAIEQLGYRPAGPAVVGCSVDKLLSERPACLPEALRRQTDSLSSTTQQPDNLTTAPEPALAPTPEAPPARVRAGLFSLRGGSRRPGG